MGFASSIGWCPVERLLGLEPSGLWGSNWIQHQERRVLEWFEDFFNVHGLIYHAENLHRQHFFKSERDPFLKSGNPARSTQTLGSSDCNRLHIPNHVEPHFFCANSWLSLGSKPGGFSNKFEWHVCSERSPQGIGTSFPAAHHDLAGADFPGRASSKISSEFLQGDFLPAWKAMHVLGKLWIYSTNVL